LLFLSPSLNWAAVGKVTEQTGPTEIVRDKKSLASAVNTGVEMNDTIVTARARAELTFEDATKVKITEQSKLIIDDFVYDPRSGTGKLAMKVALGTARYTSGQIAKNSPQQVAIKTPTASIAVRGTDFSMTVDELGRSLIMLLPSCDSKSCVTGAIEVSNEMGTVYLNQAYQAVMVASVDKPPTNPVFVSIDQLNINNMLIISPPRELDDDNQNRREQKTALDVNFLDRDLLKFNGLDNELNRVNPLDTNFLDGNMLENLLDASLAAFTASQESMLTMNTMLPKYTVESGLKYQIDDTDRLILTKRGTHTMQVIVNKEQNAVLDLTQDGVPVYQQINTGGTTKITIVQK
jgi:hypothetical protein